MAKTDRIQLEYKLTFTTPFHCGTGLSAGIIDRTVVRDGTGSLYIPGSTFKGVVRVQCERLARLYASGNEAELRQQIVGIHDERQALTAIRRPATMIERLFGSRSRPGLLSFDDARQGEEVEGCGGYKNSVEQTDLQMQVRLDRRTRTAVKQAFYTSEVGLKDLTFYGSICGWLNCTPIEGIEGEPSYSLLLLLAGISMLEQVGGSKSTGKGQCVCQFTHLSMNAVEISNAIVLSWLEQLDTLIFYPENAESLEERQ